MLVRELLNGKETARNIQRTALIAFGLRIASAAVAYLSQVFLARWMGGFEYGVFVFVWVWVLILGGLSPLGLNVSIIRFIPEYAERGQYSLLRGLIFGSQLLVFLSSTIVALAGLAGLYFFGHLLGEYYILPGYLVLICVPLYAMTGFGDAICRAKSWIILALIPGFVLRPLLILLTMFGAYLLGWPMVATTAVGAAIIATWIAGILQLVLLQRRISDDLPAGDKSYDMGFWLKVSLPILFVNGSELLLANTDIVIISQYLTPIDVGIYFAALKTMSLISFVHFAVGAAAGNRFSSLNASGSKGELKSFIRQSVHWTFWPSLAGTMIVLALGWPLLLMFGEEFTAGYSVMFILAVGFLVRAAMGPAEYILNMLGEHKRCAAIFFATAGFNLIGNIVLVPYFGILGAALSTSASMMIAAWLFNQVAKKHLDVELAIWRHPEPKVVENRA